MWPHVRGVRHPRQGAARPRADACTTFGIRTKLRDEQTYMGTLGDALRGEVSRPKEKRGAEQDFVNAG